MSNDTADQDLARAFNPSVEKEAEQIMRAADARLANARQVGVSGYATSGAAIRAASDLRPDDVIFYKDDAGEWRWTRKAANGQVVGASSEGYKNFKECKANLSRQGECYEMDVE